MDYSSAQCWKYRFLRIISLGIFYLTKRIRAMILEKEILELFTYRLIVLANIKLNLFHVKCAQ